MLLSVSSLDDDLDLPLENYSVASVKSAEASPPLPVKEPEPINLPSLINDRLGFHQTLSKFFVPNESEEVRENASAD